MATRIISHIIPKIYVLLDTSILFHENKKLIVNEQFDGLVKDFKGKCNLQFCLPEVVKEELVYQHKQHALSLLNQGTKAFKNIGEIFNKHKKNSYTEREINTLVLKRFDRWAKTEKIHILKTPLEKIKLKELIHDSVNRIPPFESNKSEGEKGFRDAIIMHTVLNIPNIYSNKKGKFAFICNDKLLLEATKKRFNSKEQLIGFETIGEFTSYLRLALEKFSEKWIKVVTKRAKLKFFDKEKDTGIWRTENLGKKIKEKFPNEFYLPRLSLALSSGMMYEELDKGTFWISPPIFQEVIVINNYLWKTTINHKQKYKKRILLRSKPYPSTLQTLADDSTSLSKTTPFLKDIHTGVSEKPSSFLEAFRSHAVLSPLLPENTIEHIVEYARIFEVTWSSKINKVGRFSNIKVLDINFIRKGFEIED